MPDEKAYPVLACVCGSTDIKAMNDPLFMPRIECQKCYRFTVGDTVEQVIERWNKGIEAQHASSRQDTQTE
jgi:hypothetical protein